MIRQTFKKLLLVVNFGCVAALGFTNVATNAAEIALRNTANVSNRIVMLGDICDIQDSREQVREALAAIELGPAPQQGTTAQWNIRDVQDRLHMLGLKLADHRFQGATSVTISCGSDTNHVAANDVPVQVSATQQRTVESNITRLVKLELNELAQRQKSGVARTTSQVRRTNYFVSDANQFDVLPKLTNVQVNQLSQDSSPLRIASELQPAAGKQQIIVESTGRTPQRYTINVELRSQPQIVVVARQLQRGTVITADDVEMQSRAKSSNTTPFTSIEDVVGKEVTKAINPGQIVDADSVRSPIMVRRGDVVDVTVRSGGVRVQTKARAKADGSVGDAIQIEMQNSKQPILARISGFQTVDILGSADHR